MRIGFPYYPVRKIGNSAGVLRSTPAREPSTGKVERTPEKVNRAALAGEAAAKPLKYLIGPGQDSPAPVGVIRLVGPVLVILGEREGVFHLGRDRPNPDLEAELTQQCGILSIKIGDRPRCQGESPGSAFGGSDQQVVIDEVQLDLEGPIAIWHRRGGKPTRREIQCNVPPMIN
jgi:hypothetical protein